jgi:putative phage-type endonuclease
MFISTCSFCGYSPTLYFMDDLESLVDELDDLQADSDSELESNYQNDDSEKSYSLFDENGAQDFIENTLLLMEEFVKDNPKLISEPTFHENFEYEIKELILPSLDALKPKPSVWYEWNQVDQEFREEIDEILEKVFEIFFTTIYPHRSYERSLILNPLTVDQKQYLERKLNVLKAKPQPPQRTKEWYEFRYQLITASNAYKAFESQATQNQLIYEKCHPLQTASETVGQINTSTTLHWGQMCEPCSVLFYEREYNTRVGDFGCIQHETYSFLGASPDGINIDPTNDRYGRMLEIKNIVNREIDGVPKKEYWIQMQLQMETCDLDECDFLETKFTRYNCEADYLADPTDEKCTILYFANGEGNPVYVYQPLEYLVRSLEEVEEWVDQEKEKAEKKGLLWIANIYLKLEVISCVLVTRNRQWFQDNVHELEAIWRIIEKERETGYEHRASVKKEKRSLSLTDSVDGKCAKGQQGQGCLIKFNKETGKTSIV